jgi:hypothetical protein
VLLDDGDEHVPLAAVGGHRVEEKGDRPVVGVAPGCLDHGFEEVVGPLQLVPEHGVVLGELEVLDVELLHGPDAEQVETGEEPAPAAALLVGDLPVVEEVREGVIGGVDDVTVEGNVVDRHPGDRVLRHPVTGVDDEFLAQERKILGAERVVHGPTLPLAPTTGSASPSGPGRYRLNPVWDPVKPSRSYQRWASGRARLLVSCTR